MSNLGSQFLLAIEFIIRFLSAGRKVFREFLRSEYSEENMLFWLACEELKQEQSSEGVEEKARLIYEDYISILSPKEVTIYTLTLYKVLLVRSLFHSVKYKYK